MSGFYSSPRHVDESPSGSRASLDSYTDEAPSSCFPSGSIAPAKSMAAKEKAHADLAQSRTSVDELPAYEAPMPRESASPAPVHAGDYVFYFRPEDCGAIQIDQDGEPFEPQTRSMCAKVVLFGASLLCLFSVTFSLLSALAVWTADPASTPEDTLNLLLVPFIDAVNVSLLGTIYAFTQGAGQLPLNEAMHTIVHMTVAEAVPAYILAAYLHVKLTGFCGR